MSSAVKPLAVIILNWNGRKLLEKFLPAVVATTDKSASRLVVADNGSTDDSLVFLSERFPEVEVWPFDKNYGFAGGYNKALEMCDNPYVVLLNSDVATSAGWDSTLLQFMQEHRDVGACQPKILSYVHRDMFEYAGASGGYIDRNGYPYCRGRIFDVCEFDKGQYDSVVEVAWASGAALMVRRDVYLKCGGLDAGFFAHMEEIDLCWRVRLAGYRIMCVPSAVVYHLGGGSLPTDDPKKTYLNFRNNLLMLHKNLPDSVRRRVLLHRRLLDTVAWIKYVVTLDWANAAAIFRAHRHFAKMARLYSTHPSVSLLNADADSSRNILVDYYLRRRKHYSDLK